MKRARPVADRVGMHRLAAALIVALGLGAAAAQAGDPLQSAECRRALDALQAQEAAAAAELHASARFEADGFRRVPDAKLAAARRHAALACLASRADDVPSHSPPEALQGRLAQPPIAVAPVGVAPPRQSSPRPIEPIPAPLRPPARPQFIVSCDAFGCWADDGSRLNRIGPNLAGPRGLCTVQGSVLSCP